MEKKNNKQLISEMKETLGPQKRPVLESLIFDDGPVDNEADNPGYDEGGEFDDTMDFQEEENTETQGQPEIKSPEVKNYINNIRLLALQGIQKIADNPTSAEYDTLKKIWQLCDKSVDVKDTMK